MSRTLHDDPSVTVVAGDWHMNTKWAMGAVNWAKDAHDADTIVHVGDFGYTFERIFVDYLTSTLQVNAQRLYFVDGNHDDHDYLASLPTNNDGTKSISDNIFYLPRGLRWNWHGASFLALGGAHSVDRKSRVPGVSWWAGETIKLSDADKVCEEGPVDIMFTHDCPSGVTIPGLDTTGHYFPITEIKAANIHRALLAEIVDTVQPRRLYCGHYHTRETLVRRTDKAETKIEILSFDGTGFDRNMIVMDID